jgi:exocyst complex component 2
VLPTTFVGKATPPPATILITSKEFDAKKFLLHVHSGTSYRDLERGAENLATDVEARQDTTRNLVRTQFSKFVNAKSRIDSFYSQMRESSLILSKNAGFGAFERSLEAVLPTVTDVLYAPMLARRAKAEKIRFTLAILEQWRFFFHLPSHLNDLIKKVGPRLRDSVGDGGEGGEKGDWQSH